MSATTIQWFVYIDDKTEFLTIEQIPNNSAMAVCPIDFAFSTSEENEANRAVFCEHKAKLEQAIKKGMVKPLASLHNPQFPGGVASLVKRAQFSKFFASLGIGIKPILEFTSFARPLFVDRVLLALSPDAVVMWKDNIGGAVIGPSKAGDCVEIIQERIKRQAEGFFTVKEAAQILADSRAGIDVHKMIRDMQKAVVNLERLERPVRLVRNHGDQFPLADNQPSSKSQNLVKESDINVWLDGKGVGYRFPPASAESKPQSEAAVPSVHTDERSNIESNATIADSNLVELFQPVTVVVLEKMFPANDKWKSWAERAARNGLKSARKARGLFNPYLASVWFLKQRETGWDIARCNRVLANNLPAQSKDKKHLLTGELSE